MQHIQRERIRAALNGEIIDRTPTFDLLCNDAIIEDVTGETFTGENDTQLLEAAISRLLDGTRGFPYPRKDGETYTDDEGILHQCDRWTSWIKEKPFKDGDSEALVPFAERMIDRLNNESFAENDSGWMHSLAIADRIAPAVFCRPNFGVGMNQAYVTIGLDNFTFFMYDYPELCMKWVKAYRDNNLRMIEAHARMPFSDMAVIYFDLAFKGGLLFSEDMLDQFDFFGELTEYCELLHQEGKKVMFHSDGEFHRLVGKLIDCGIDALNPIEKSAGMDIFKLREDFPDLTFVGGVDVTHLLVSGSPDEVKAETEKIITRVGKRGRLIIGSSTEVGNDVPLENYVAFYDVVVNTKL